MERGWVARGITPNFSEAFFSSASPKAPALEKNSNPIYDPMAS